MVERRSIAVVMTVLGVLLTACGGVEPTEETLSTAPTTRVTTQTPATTEATMEESTPPSSAPTTSTAEATPQMGDLEGWTTTTILLDDRELTVAVADSARERSQGLRGVEDLGDLDGMLFVFGQPRDATFVMEDTLIPLDIGFFDPGGRLVKTYEMVPCEPNEECDVYPSTAAVSHALEVPADSLTFSPDTVLKVR